MFSLIKIFVSALICMLSTTILYAEEANPDLVSAHGVFVFNTCICFTRVKTFTRVENFTRVIIFTCVKSCLN